MVPKAMKDPASAHFGSVWGMAPHIACGYVNGKNGFGAMVGERRFIYAAGAVEFQDGSRNFARRWNSVCVERLLSEPPRGITGMRWGARPPPTLKLLARPTAALALYIPTAPPEPFEGVHVAEADYRFDRGRLYAGDIFLDGEMNRDAAKAALVKKYGRPLEADDDAHSYEWRWPDHKVSVEMSFNERSGRTQITFAHGAH
jgi:hypothetical protein